MCPSSPSLTAPVQGRRPVPFLSHTGFRSLACPFLLPRELGPRLPGDGGPGRVASLIPFWGQGTVLGPEACGSEWMGFSVCFFFFLSRFALVRREKNKRNFTGRGTNMSLPRQETLNTPGAVQGESLSAMGFFPPADSHEKPHLERECSG